MTPEEHRLMLFMLTNQLQALKALVEALKAKGVLDSDDLSAYGAFVESEDAISRDLLMTVLTRYKGHAKTLGIQTGL
jgi:hypothetical protein